MSSWFDPDSRGLSDCIIDDQNASARPNKFWHRAAVACRGAAVRAGRGRFGVPAPSIMVAALFIFREPHSNYCAST
jgi:hypothetical protein